MLLLPLALVALQESDHRNRYDVEAYRLDLSVDPVTQTLAGEVAIQATVTDAELATVVLDLRPPFVVTTVEDVTGPLGGSGPLAGPQLVFRRDKVRLEVDFATPKKKGESFCVAVTYSGKPRARGSFAGFHWETTKSGKPWIGTSCQDEGAASWWPCKDSFFHPEDKPERVFVNATVPAGLVAVSNGRLFERTTGEGVETFRWAHEFAIPTYSVTLNVAPYVSVASEIEIEGSEAKIPFEYWVLEEGLEKAKVQFAEVPALLAAYSRAFGPYPFQSSKFGLVQTSFWGMEHSTAVAYGSSFPAWIDEHGGDDPFATRNELFDYILVHETAHEWWGNAVTAKTWGDFWIHEGFATYGELVYLELAVDEETAQEHFEALRERVSKQGSLYRGKGLTSAQAYDEQLYQKGACVLATLRSFVGDDELWWKSLREFQARFRGKNADTDDFRAVVEDVTKRDLKQFFDEWFYGRGYPIVDGVVTAKPQKLVLDLDDKGTDATGFHVPVLVTWKDGQQAGSQSVVLAPGKNHVEIATKLKARDAEVSGLDRILCEHHVRYE